MEIAFGTKFKSLIAITDDDEDGIERITPANTVGEIITIDNYPAQGITYGFALAHRNDGRTN